MVATIPGNKRESWLPGTRIIISSAQDPLINTVTGLRAMTSMQKVFLEIGMIPEIRPADMGSVIIFNVHTHFSLVTGTDGRSRLFLPSLAVHLSPTEAARELATAPMSLQAGCVDKKRAK